MGKSAVSQGSDTSRGVRASLLPTGLREKLFVAFALMSVMPLLVLGYVVTNHVFPHLSAIWDLSLVVGITAILSVLGFLVFRGMIVPIVKMASEARAIARGELGRRVETQGPGELGELGQALNQISQRVRENMTQLRVYGEQTHMLNTEINQKIVVLSSLLQASHLITQAAPVEEVIVFLLDKLTLIEETELNCFLEPVEESSSFRVRAAMGSDSVRSRALISKTIEAPWLSRILEKPEILVVDRRSDNLSAQEFLQKFFDMRNAVCQPLTYLGKAGGILLSANRKEDFAFREESLELLKVFAKQMAVAIENDRLLQRAQKLEVLDEMTGLHNARSIRDLLGEEIRRAIQFSRPCSFALFRLGNFQRFQDRYGRHTAEEVLRQVANLLKSSLSPVDRAGRLSPDQFAVILPERNKREAVELAQRIRHKIESGIFTNGPQQFQNPLAISAGVSENPIDGSTSEELIAKAAQAVRHESLENEK